jgi:AraC-like DNA-binding protein
MATTAPFIQSGPMRRSYDRLDVARLGAGQWAFHPSVPRASHESSVIVLHVVRGRATLRRAPQPIEMAAGDLMVVPASGSHDVLTEAGSELLVVRLADSMIGPHRPAMQTMFGMSIATQRGTASLVAHLLRDLANQAPDYAPSQPGRLAQHVAGLIGLMCVDGGEALGRPRHTLLQRATEFIEEHLADLDLAPDLIAASLNVSTRTLHRLFENEGLTINGWTRSRRLEHCRLELLDPDHAEESVSTIGSRWGLWDAAHFSRVFKANFGLSPRAYRAAAAAGVLEDRLAAPYRLASA